MAYQADCSYYEVKDIQKLKLDRSLNIFHNLHEFLTSMSSEMDIIAITETSQRNNVNFIINTESTPSNLSKGGTALYIDDKFDSFERTDIKIQNDNFESTYKRKKIKKYISVATLI